MAESSGGHFTCLHLQSISHFKQNNTTAQCSDRRLCLPAAAIAVNQTAALTKSVTAKKNFAADKTVSRPVANNGKLRKSTRRTMAAARREHMELRGSRSFQLQTKSQSLSVVGSGVAKIWCEGDFCSSWRTGVHNAGQATGRNSRCPGAPQLTTSMVFRRSSPRPPCQAQQASPTGKNEKISK